MELKIITEQTLFGKEFRIYGTTEEPLFLAKDIAELIEYSEGNASHMCSLLESGEVIKLFCECLSSCSGTKPEFSMAPANRVFISEDGLYEILMQSRKPIAKTFKKEVKQILKTIRKTLKTLENVEHSGAMDGLAFIKDSEIMTTSLIISKETKKEHSKIMRDIDEELLKIDAAKIGDISVMKKEMIYFDSMNRPQKCYEINEQLTLILLVRYSAIFRYKITDAFITMRKTLIKLYQARAVEQVLAQDNRLRQFVYVIGDPIKNINKIGVAQDVQKRLKQLQTGNGTELEILWISNVCSNAYEIEKIAHNNFNQNKVLNEWFLVSPNKIVNFLEQQKFTLKSEFNNKLGLSKTIEKTKGFKKMSKTTNHTEHL